MRIVASSVMKWMEYSSYSGTTTVGSLTATRPPFCTTDTPGPTMVYKGIVVPQRTLTFPDEGQLLQGPAFYRNEKSVQHSKSTADAICSANLCPVPGTITYIPYHQKSGNWDYYGCYVVKAIEPTDWVLGPDEQACIFLTAHWGSVNYYNGIRQGQYLETYEAKGMIYSHSRDQYKLVKMSVIGPQKRYACVADMMVDFDQISLAVTEISSWRGVGTKTSWRTDAQVNSLVQKIRSRQRVALAQLQHQLGIKGWKFESEPNVSSKWYAQGQIVTRMAEQVGRLANNNAALLIELSELLQQVIALCRGNPSGLRTLLRDIRTVRTPVQAAKLMANCRLSEQYGIRLTVKDVLEVADAISRISTTTQIARASCAYSVPIPCGTAAVTEHWKMFFSANPAKAPVFAKLYLSDLIGLQNVWDFIPYSFVVDWFAPVGEILQGWDDEAMLSHLPIDTIVLGKKSTFSDYISGDEGHAWITCSYYERNQVTSFPPYATTTSHSVNTTTVLNGAALIVQRL